MTDRQYSELPTGPLSGGPVLCLDIDGVSSPVDQNHRYDVGAPTPGFVSGSQGELPRACAPGAAGLDGCTGAGLRALRLGIDLVGAVALAATARPGTACAHPPGRCGRLAQRAGGPARGSQGEGARTVHEGGLREREAP